jgi:hypothetical protein
MVDENGGRCEECAREIPQGSRSVLLSAAEGDPGRLLCLECYNREMAAAIDIEFENPTFPRVMLVDVNGNEHSFEFAVQLFGHQVSIEAFEHDVEHGYRLAISGNPADVQKLFNRLLGRIRRALTRSHIDATTFEGMPPMLDEMVARGRFEWDDDSDGQLPLVVIDGKPYTWDQFGRMLSSYEGWQFHLEIKDPADEV